MKGLLYRLLAALQGDHLAGVVDRRRLRILMYHGFCEDVSAGEPWIPAYFVTRSQLEEQLAYLSRHWKILRLSEAVELLREGRLPPRAVCLTIDDGYANNLHIAQPLLQKYTASATIFLASAYIESGDFYPFDRLRLIRAFAAQGPQPKNGYGESLPEYLNNPIDQVIRNAEPHWREIVPRLTEAQRRELRALTEDELRQLDPRVIELGAHSHNHCILRNETPERRRREIETSLDFVSRWVRRPVRLFSYPNGQPGDFSEMDKEVLRARGVVAAVSTITGANAPDQDPLELKRYPVGLYHDRHAFRAEVCGFRTFIRSVAGS
ncbi:MAG: polysaccharide deacetylase family protein [Acidobacteria bacterium]|nr:polysaccharide deacetylase family protein [Acidobacteriota bacterium]